MPIRALLILLLVFFDHVSADIGDFGVVVKDGYLNRAYVNVINRPHQKQAKYLTEGLGSDLDTKFGDAGFVFFNSKEGRVRANVLPESVTSI